MGACGSKPASADSFGQVTSTSSKRSGSTKSAPGNFDFKKPLPEFNLEGTYRPTKLLGQGGTGQTWACIDNTTGEEVAIKFIQRPLPKAIVPMILHEIKIQSDLGEGHLNIVNAKEVLLTRSHVALVMEYAAGGTMTSYVSDRWDTTDQRGGLFLSEDEARYFMMQFLDAVEYCHHNHVAHRDLKLDNTLLDASYPPRIKICDFGFAKNWDEKSNMFTQIGTPVYMSPQLIRSKSGKAGYDGCKADVWASGVLLFVMLLGMFPFEHTDHPDPNTSGAHVEVWLQQIKSSWQDNPRVKEVSGRLSAEARDLLDKIFDLEEDSRLDIDGIKHHPWWSKPLPEHLATALHQLQQEQAAIAAVPPPLSPDRDVALQALTALAACPAKADEQLHRICLTRLQRHYPLADPELLAVIMEDASYHGNAAWAAALAKHGTADHMQGRRATADLVFSKDGAAVAAVAQAAD